MKPRDSMVLADVGYLGDCWKAWNRHAKGLVETVYGFYPDSATHISAEQRDRVLRCGLDRVGWKMFTNNTPPSVYAYFLATILHGNSMTLKNAIAEKEVR